VRIVLDTNVLISGIFFSGPPSKILQAWRDKEIQFVISPDIYSEYSRVAEIISNKYADVDISEMLNLIAVHSEIIDVLRLPESICKDPDDDKFIACAISGKVKIIVSGDKNLIDTSGYKDIHVMNPREFCDKFLK
jgi:uncharacterized protein